MDIYTSEIYESYYLLMRKAEAPISVPTGKWGIARRQLLSHRSNYPFDPEGQGAGARHIMQNFYRISYILEKRKTRIYGLYLDSGFFNKHVAHELGKINIMLLVQMFCNLFLHS
ncbi:hypothetical protein C7437_10783 [Psychrobacillus insolitus]|uniref:Uncharacterized protein n=1 Tax=Psychrobacillus insolitus TaxID=1461 RepID=A0A2W7MED0_9BACI|nr:hypothetical protein C7437_10783 [Psychrobacillus insolitus]